MFKHGIFSIGLGNLNKQSQGFTLMEVSLVVAIVSTVVALAVAALGGAKGDTQDKKRKSNLVAIESAKTRYVLNSDPSILNQPTDLEEIAPYLSIGGSPVGSLFDLLEGTGKSTGDLSLGTYGGVPASYDGTMVAAGLVNVDGEWMDPESARIAYANQASSILANGGSWGDLSPEQKEGYANTYPSQAVAIGGADALNALDPSNLSPALVTGYVNNGGTWVAPYASSAGASSILWSTLSGPIGSGKRYSVYAIIDPLQPASLIGTLIDVPVTTNGNLLGGYYNYSVYYAPGEGAWAGWSVPTSNFNAITVAYGPTGNVIMGYVPGGNAGQITSILGGTGQITYILNP